MSHDNTSRLAFTVARTALAAMGDEPDSLGPQPLIKELAYAASKHRVDVDPSNVISRFMSDDVNDECRVLFTKYLHRWDYISGVWAGSTAGNTRERRDAIYDLLELTLLERERCEHLIPARLDYLEPAVIAVDHEDWYTADRRTKRFYWDAYSRYLRTKLHWPEESVVDLDRATDLIVERLSDPTRSETYQTKGLVVGYVQSGKTANFTAVIAKAADAGYRLIIVLAGTLNILRDQTQRRLDKELIGQELIQRREGGQHDYQGDSDWADFASHGCLPSAAGAFDWERLTGAKEDYQRLKAGIGALEFQKLFPARRLNDRANLEHVAARLIVLKKTPAILNRLAKDLASIRTRLDEVPALIIDDESDQASVNTERPKADGTTKRTSTNREIVALLQNLSRGQYIGYTATPFANVFINPDEAEDLFPKDYIIPLERPAGYMGVRDFFDDFAERKQDFESPERAFVRDIKATDSDDIRLIDGIDAFVLAGAIKLYREQYGFRYRHHTMLVHTSHSMTGHEEDAERCRRLFVNAGYNGGAGLTRLRKLVDDDFSKVREAQEKQLPFPPSFKAVETFIARTVARVASDPVGIVNGDMANKSQVPQFDKDPVWRILCGGTKLSRGYTVEGLTISYYRRKVTSADTLMQMGRWFGFRRGYRDLVRLFIGRAEPNGKKEPLDLHEAFRATCLDEEQFRADLRKYSKQLDPRVLPRDIPPLVPSHLLMPTSRNKMYNAVVVEQNGGGGLTERTVTPTDVSGKRFNEALVRSLLEGSELTLEQVAVRDSTGQSTRMEAAICELAPPRVLEFLRNYRWATVEATKQFLPIVAFLENGMGGDTRVRSWLLIAPQVRAGAEQRTWQAGGLGLRVVKRSRVTDGSRFKAFSDPRDRFVCEWLVGMHEGTEGLTEAAQRLRSDTRGVVLLYPCVEGEKDPLPPTMGFALVLPKNRISRVVTFSVLRSTQKDAIVVDA